jgi:hypothetical protein
MAESTDIGMLPGWSRARTATLVRELKEGEIARSWKELRYGRRRSWRLKSHISKTCHTWAARVSQGTLQAIKESIQPGQVWLFPGRSSGQ